MKYVTIITVADGTHSVIGPFESGDDAESWTIDFIFGVPGFDYQVVPLEYPNDAAKYESYGA